MLPSRFRMHVRARFRGQSPSEICVGRAEKRSPLRRADETTTDKATLLKSDYGRSAHPCDVVQPRFRRWFLITMDSGNSEREIRSSCRLLFERSAEYSPRARRGRLPFDIAIDACNLFNSHTEYYIVCIIYVHPSDATFNNIKSVIQCSDLERAC